MKQWYSPAELADLNLPGLPNKRNRMVEIASNERWQERVNQSGEPLARKRAGRGGGFEYHVDLLPLSAKVALLEGLEAPSEKPLAVSVTYDWAWFDAQNQKTKDEAGRRFAIIQTVENYAQNLKISEAVWVVSREKSVSEATIWSWLKLVEGVALADRLPALAPRRKGGGIKAEIDPELWQIFCSDFLRFSKPTYAACYERTSRIAREKGLPMASLKTFQRRLEKEISIHEIKLKREGDKAYDELTPWQTRSVADLYPMHTIVLDGHRWDVQTSIPSKYGTKPDQRPVSVAILDLYSRKILAVRTGFSETAELTRLALLDVFKKYGVPKIALMDNGRGFASSMISGGAPTRYRWQISEDEAAGILVSLGIRPQFCTPGHGQAKPIERSFRDLAEYISKAPFCEGAYLGNNPVNTPANRGARTVDFDEFVEHINMEVIYHNTRMGRRTETAKGSSFDAVFAQKYVDAPIGKATEAQLRIASLTASNIHANSKNGSFKIENNTYWSVEMTPLAGQKIIVRYDPDQLHDVVHVYKLSGEFYATVKCQNATGFYDTRAAKESRKLRKDIKKATKTLIEKRDLLSAKELSERYSTITPPDYENPNSKVVRAIPTRRTGNAQPVLQELKSAKTAHLDAFVAAMDAAAAKEKAKPKFTIFDGGLAAKNGGQNP